MKWTRIIDTELGRAAWDILEETTCDYHNGWHVLKMYNYLAETNEPYDECLDWAVLFHDIVYDNQPDKEYRSADMFVKKTAFSGNGCNLTFEDRCRVVNMIYATENHICENSNQSAIIRADLHALTSPLDTFYNFQSIMDESMNLYKIDEVTFADNNIKFMSGLYDRVEKNMEKDPEHREFYKDVKRGIVSTINLSRILKGDL
jgi:predicted metal-dependent HD superfamily phosphohydrolase